MLISSFLTFPREGIFTPRETTALRTLAVPLLEGQAPRSTQPAFWFCCACAISGRDDPVGLVYDEYHTKCWACQHTQCNNCALSSMRKKEYIIRTKGGLYASPKYIDLAYWECLCGEWRLNRLSEETMIGITRCANPRCLGREANFAPVSLNTVVMNRYGQRLGTLDQSTMQAGGPWALQRRALGDPEAALAVGLRPAPCRFGGEDIVPELWREGEPAPRYPLRPPPPDSKLLLPQWRHRDAQSRLVHEYLMGYLRGIPVEPRGPASKNLDKGGRLIDELSLSSTNAPGEDCLPTPHDEGMEK